jgi:hypothetical protein
VSKDPGDLVPLSRFRASLTRPRGVRRMDALLEAPDPEAAVAALSVADFYFLVKEVGLADADDLVALATPRQIRGALDLEMWDRDRVQFDAAGPWLASLIEAGPEKLTEVWAGLDAELRALFFARAAIIIDHSLGEEVPEEEERPSFSTPDTFFTVIVTAEREDEIRMIYRLVDDLYRVDQELARHTLLAARSELPSELEEMSYRWRAGRMADLGYADFYDALEVFRPLDPDTVNLDEATAEPRQATAEEEAHAAGLPAPVAEPIAGTFLARALEQITDAAESERLEAAVVHLVNRVLSALRVKPGDEEPVRAATAAAAATVSIGLEHLTAGRIERAPAALAAVSLTRLHRLGHSIVLRLARMARLLAPRALTAGEPSQSVLEALLRTRPQFPTALDDPPGAALRPFREMADVRTIAAHLTDLAARIALADALGVDLLAMAQAPEPRPELDDHVRTALARHLAGGELDAAPLEPHELERLRTGALERGSLSHADRASALRALAELAARNRIAVGGELMARLVAGWLDEIEAQVGRVIRSSDKT